MASERTTRRRYLGALGTALAAGLAGCSGTSGGEETGTTTATSTTTDSNTGSNAAPSDGSESPYTRVYEETIPSVVLVKTSSSEGRGGQGSGWVFRDNYVVTNAHVVSDATDVQVRFSRGQWRTASVVGVDQSSDLAVLEVQNPPGYAAALPLVETQPAAGTEVVAIGSPFGLEGSVTSGLVSGTNRLIPAPNGQRIPDAIQTSAPVNPGNSGGPLVTLEGRVVGVINSGGGENLAFAISAALVKRVVPSLIQNGEYEHASLGVSVRTVTPRIADDVGLERSRGVVVTEVRSDGPAAGVLQAGDVVVSIDGQRIDSRQQLASYVALESSPGDTVELAVRRDGERRTVELTLGERPE